MTDPGPAAVTAVVLSGEPGLADRLAPAFAQVPSTVETFEEIAAVPDSLACDVVVVGADIEAPVAVAQEARRRWPEVATIVVARADVHAALRSELLVAPKIGRATRCVQDGDAELDNELARTLRRVHQRHSYRADVRRAPRVEVTAVHAPPAAGVLLDEILTTLPSAIVVVGGDGSVYVWNRMAEDLFGVVEGDAVGRPIEQLVPEALRPSVKEVLVECRVTRSGQAVRRSALVSADREPQAFELLATPFASRSEAAGDFALLVVRDVTELRRLEELQVQIQASLEADRAKSEFLASMSHELRTPMTAVIGLSQILAGTSLDNDQRQYLSIIESNADHLLDLINDILDFSKIEAGQVTLQFEPTSLRRVVEQGLDAVAARAAERGLELIYDLEAGVPPWVETDAGRLRQALVNLLSNAVKFTDEGEIEVRVAGRPFGSGAHEVEFVVRDTGIGIAADQQEHLFDAFTQVDSSDTREYEGTGLGLAITKRIIELMGGRLWVESAPGEGSTFHATLMVQEAEERAEAPEPSAPAADLARCITLVVDDNATNLQILQKYVRTWEMVAVPTQSPVEALEWLRAGRRFDLMIVDQQMPQMTGVDLIREGRELLGADMPPTLLLTSVNVDAVDVLPGLVTVPKPIRPAALHEVIAGLLRERSAPPEPPEPPPSAGEGSPQILVAEDNSVNQHVLQVMLKSLGYEPDVVADGRAAVDSVVDGRYDVVFMDMRMPVMDGLDAAREIRRALPDEEGPYIVGLTANALSEHREACLAAGMDDYISKPLTLDDFERALDRARQRRPSA